MRTYLAFEPEALSVGVLVIVLVNWSQLKQSSAGWPSFSRSSYCVGVVSAVGSVGA